MLLSLLNHSISIEGGTRVVTLGKQNKDLDPFSLLSLLQVDLVDFVRLIKTHGLCHLGLIVVFPSILSCLLGNRGKLLIRRHLGAHDTLVKSVLVDIDSRPLLILRGIFPGLIIRVRTKSMRCTAIAGYPLLFLFLLFFAPPFDLFFALFTVVTILITESLLTVLAILDLAPPFSLICLG